MACVKHTFFGIPLVRETAPDLASVWGAEREESALLIFARSALLWRMVRSRVIRRGLQDGRDAVVALGAIARRQARLATGCAVSVFVPLQAVVRILTRAEEDGAALFLVDTDQHALRSLEANARDTFPGMRIVGRAALHGPMAPSVTTAIRKSEPRVVLVGRGTGAVLRWALENRDEMGAALVVIAPDAVGLMVGRGTRGTVRAVVFLPLRILMIPVLLIHRVVVARRGTPRDRQKKQQV